MKNRSTILLCGFHISIEIMCFLVFNVTFSNFTVSPYESIQQCVKAFPFYTSLRFKAKEELVTCRNEALCLSYFIPLPGALEFKLKSICGKDFAFVIYNKHLLTKHICLQLFA